MPGLDQFEQRLGGVGMAADGDDGVAVLVGQLDDALELAAVLVGAERGLVGLEVDGEGHDGALVERAAGAERLDLALATASAAETLAACAFGLGEVRVKTGDW